MEERAAAARMSLLLGALAFAGIALVGGAALGLWATRPLASLRASVDEFRGSRRWREPGRPRTAELSGLTQAIRELAAEAKVREEGASAELAELRRVADHLAREAPRLRYLSCVVESSDDAILTKDLEGTITSWNAAAEKLYGYRAEEVIGRPVSIIVPPERLDELEQIFAELRAGAHVRHLETVRIDRFGQPIDVSLSVSPVRDATGTMIGFAAIGRDIGKQKLADERLRLALSSGAAILFTAPAIDSRSAGLNELLGPFAFSWISESVRSILGIEPEAALAPGWWLSRVHPDDINQLQAEIRALRAGTPAPLEYRIRDANDEYRWMSSSLQLSSLRSEHAVVGTWTDVTERRKLQSQFEQAQKMEAVGQLAGGVAHDFNNMLAVIRGSIDLIRTDPEHRGAEAEIEAISSATEHAAGLTRQLLAFSRRQVLMPRPLNLNEVVADTQKLLGRLIGEDIEIATVLAPRLDMVYADVGQIEQVLVNLTVNARDAMPRGGKLTIETADVDLDGSYEARRPLVQPGRYVMIAVTDTGEGMDEATREHIFEPFFTTKEKGKGTGLGLATVYGIVKQTGGFIWVYSELGVGTTFKIYLPSIGTGAEVAGPGPQTARSAAGQGTVLVVDDDGRVRGVIAAYLRRSGYTVLEAGSGEEAHDLAQSGEAEIDLVVTDVAMPGMGGIELIRRLREIDPGLPAIFTSGYASDAIVRHGVLAPGSPFLQKPFSMSALTNLAQELLKDDATGSA